jgi:DhnA family fructose-bisphosphate aldolase class Ia
MKTVNELKTGKGGKSKMKKLEKDKKIVKKNAFGFKEGSNKAIISDMFLDNGIKLQDAAKKITKKLNKEEPKAISMILGMVKRLLKKGHKIEVLITTSSMKNVQPEKSKNPSKVSAEIAPIKESAEESCKEKNEEP